MNSIHSKLDCLCIRMYKYSFAADADDDGPNNPARTSTAPNAPTRPLTRVAIAGATGYAGQELVRILARHPARHADGGDVVGRHQHAAAAAGARAHLGRRRHAARRRSARRAKPTSSSWRCPRRRRRSWRRTLLERGARVIDLSGAFRIRERRRSAAVVSGDGGASRGHGLRADRGRIRRRSASARLVSNPGCYPTAALLALEPLQHAGLLDRPGRRRREVGHLGRGQDADRPHALLREPRQRGGVRRLLAPAHGGDRAGAGRERSRSCRIWCRSIAASSRRSTASLKPGHDRGSRSPTRSQPRTPTRRSCGSPAAALPEIKHVAHTNFCDIGWKVDDGARPHRAGRRSSTTW